MTNESDTPRTLAMVTSDDYGKEYIYEVGKVADMERELIAATAALTTAEQQLAAVKRDAKRLDWVEQIASDGQAIDIVINWTHGGKRYPQGIRGAIDAAIDALAGGEKG